MKKIKYISIRIFLVFLFTAGIFLCASSEQDAVISSAQTTAQTNIKTAFLFPYTFRTIVKVTSEQLMDFFPDDTPVISDSIETAAAPAPFTQPVFSVSDTELTVCWENADLSQTMKTELTDSLLHFTEEGYRVSFLLYDLASGNSISYCSADSYYSASTIKGPYAACIAETHPESVTDFNFLFEDIIHYSDNDAYFYLWEIYGTEDFDAWANEAGCTGVDISELYSDITARDLTLLWIKMYSYFTSDSPGADWISELYTDTLNSCIAEALGDTYTVYSKAGWIFEDDYYNVQNDAGIVMSPENPYVIVVLSDAYEQMELLESLVCSIDHAHTELIEYSE